MLSYSEEPQLGSSKSRGKAPAFEAVSPLTSVTSIGFESLTTNTRQSTLRTVRSREPSGPSLALPSRSSQDNQTSNYENLAKEFTERVQFLKAEIANKHSHNKELSAELYRIEAVKGKKIQRIEQQQNNRWMTLTNENQTIVTKMNDFIEKIANDILVLTKKQEKLQGNMNELLENKDFRLQSAKQEGAKRLSTQKKTWIQQENKSFEQLFASKQTQIINKQNVEIYTPKLNQLIQEKQSIKQQIIQENTKKEMNLQQEYQELLHKQLYELKQNNQQKIMFELRQIEQVIQSKVKETQDSQIHQIAQIEQTFQLEKENINKRTKMNETLLYESHDNSIKLFYDHENQLQSELIKHQQEEIQSLLSTHQQQIMNLKQKQEEELQQIRQTRQVLQQNTETLVFKRLKQHWLELFTQETMDIEHKLEKEYNMKKFLFEETFIKEIDNLRLSNDTRLLELRQAEEK